MINRQHLHAIVKNFQGKRIAVVGDLMLDVYVWGKASRISPEAPVPIVQVKKRTQCLGGAANVMRNVVTLGGKSDAFGVVGADANGEELRRMLGDYQIEATGVLTDASRRTTEKQRVIAGSQQLLRIDYEDLEPVSADYRASIAAELIARIRRGEIDAVIFEDYAKGLIDSSMAQEITDAANAAGIIVTIDPNPKQHLDLRGLTVMKPNRTEAFALAGKYINDPQGPPEEDRELMDVAAILMKTWSPRYLLISLAAQGLALFDREGNFNVIPTRAREVFDVSGAGDTVIAAYTLALAAGAAGIEAAEIANHAAGIVVGKVGTVTVSTEELLESFNHGD